MLVSRASTGGLASVAAVPSQRPTQITCLTAVLPMISARLADTPLKMTMISTPASFSWCSSSRGV